MRASVIIPVWNGSALIGPCLDAVLACSGPRLSEVVCVDNASTDDSAARIHARHPEARVLRQAVNLGFAGGVNAGIDAACGDVLVLLNQDTVVQPGWLDALLDGLDGRAGFGIAGATILDAAGLLSHTGAFVRRPDAEGVHLTESAAGPPRVVEYVTGAVMAITRATWDSVGRFDEGYYPAYYEDCDYCYRARHRGIRTVHVPDARAVHLQRSTEPSRDPIRAAANHHFVRYRFVAKHWEEAALTQFFAAERTALGTENDFARVMGRVPATRELLRRLDEVLACQERDLGAVVAPARQRQLHLGFAEILRTALQRTCVIQHLRLPYGEPSAASRRPPLQHGLRAVIMRPLRIVADKTRGLWRDLAAPVRVRLGGVEDRLASPQPRLSLHPKYDDR